MKKLPASARNIVMPLVLSIMMTFIVSCISTLHAVGLAPHFFTKWLGAWALSWVVAFPTLLLVLPVVRKITDALVEAGPVNK